MNGRRRIESALSILLLALGAALPAVAVPGAPKGGLGAPGFTPKATKLPQADIDKAIGRGVSWLKGAQAPTDERGITHDELALYTLYHAGVSKEDPVFQSLLKAVVDREPSKTYSVAVGAMCLAEMDAAGYQWKLLEYAQFLMDNQAENGQWGYGEPIPLPKRPVLTKTPSSEPKPTVQSGGGGEASAEASAAPAAKPLYGTVALAPRTGPGGKTEARVPVRRRRRGPPGDNSNSQYAALGLRACHAAGIDLDRRVVEDALKWWEKSIVMEKNAGPRRVATGSGILAPPGGWGYGNDGSTGSAAWGSMTVGGVGAVAIYRSILGQRWDRDPLVAAGVAWLDANWTLTEIPKGKENGRTSWQYYYLYGLERVGMLVGTDTVGSHDWYDEGATYLLKDQGADGSWKGATHENPQARLWDTCFAILFLKRATKPLVYTR